MENDKKYLNYWKRKVAIKEWARLYYLKFRLHQPSIFLKKITIDKPDFQHSKN